MAVTYREAIKRLELEERLIINPDSFTDEELKDDIKNGPNGPIFRGLRKNARDLRRMKNDIDTTLKKWGVDSLEQLTTGIGKLVEEKHELLANQKPSDLPSSWKTELARIPNLENELSQTRNNLIQEQNKTKQLEIQITNKNNDISQKEKTIQTLQLKNEKLSENQKKLYGYLGDAWKLISHLQKDLQTEKQDKTHIQKELDDALTILNKPTTEIGTQTDLKTFKKWVESENLNVPILNLKTTYKSFITQKVYYDWEEELEEDEILRNIFSRQWDLQELKRIFTLLYILDYLYDLEDDNLDFYNVCSWLYKHKQKLSNENSSLKREKMELESSVSGFKNRNEYLEEVFLKNNFKVFFGILHKKTVEKTRKKYNTKSLYLWVKLKQKSIGWGIKDLDEKGEIIWGDVVPNYPDKREKTKNVVGEWRMDVYSLI